MLTDTQINDLSQKMNIPLEGCFFKDELPSKLNVNKVYIINMEDSVDDDGNQNQGTHWTMAYIRETPNGKLQPIYFDPYGVSPPENVKNIIKKQTKLNCPYTHKDIQSLMNNACGFYCLACAHYICSYKHRTNDLYEDIDDFLDMFDDLNTSVDWKKNEYMLKHFFLSEDPNTRKPVDVLSQTHNDYDRILNEDEKGGVDMMKIPVGVKMMDK